MALYIVFDTQDIVEKFRRGDKDYITHSFNLFLDFFGGFNQFLAIFMYDEEKKKKRTKKWHVSFSKLEESEMLKEM